MKKPKGYDEAMIYTDRRRLPAGGYVVEIKQCTEETYPSGDKYLDIVFDISEGEYRDYYRNQFEESTLPDKKYKGHIRLNVPKDDGSEADTWTLRRFKTAITAIEHSNEDYSFDFDEKTLKGKTAGLLFRNKEYSWQGREGYWTEPFLFISADRVRSGDFEVPADKLLTPKEDVKPAREIKGFEAIDDNDLPF